MRLLLSALLLMFATAASAEVVIGETYNLSPTRACTDLEAVAEINEAGKVGGVPAMQEAHNRLTQIMKDGGPPKCGFIQGTIVVLGVEGEVEVEGMKFWIGRIRSDFVPFDLYLWVPEEIVEPGNNA